MFKNESNISDFAFLVFLTAPIWIVLLMGYEFFKNLRDIIIYCAWGGAYIYMDYVLGLYLAMSS